MALLTTLVSEFLSSLDVAVLHKRSSLNRDSVSLVNLPHQHEDFLRVTRFISEMPLSPSDTVQEVIQNQSGSNLGKHLLLAECYNTMGLAYSHIVSCFNWRDQQLELPRSLRKLIEEQYWEQVHNTLKVITPLGNSIEIDVSWNSRLSRFGFRTLPNNWFGESSFQGVPLSHKLWSGNDGMPAARRQIANRELYGNPPAEKALHEMLYSWSGSLDTTSAKKFKTPSHSVIN